MNQADTAWMLISTALVLLMTPALAFFYGGLARSKNALNTMMMSFISLGFVAVAWALIGYTLAFSGTNSWIGDLSNVFLNGVGLEAKGTIPHMLFMAFQGTFCIITAALISGAIIERMRFSAYVAFITIWAIAIYAPIAHWVWGGGWLAQLGAWDFAGGTVVHVNAAAAAFVAALVIGKRTDYGSSSILPHNVPFALLGAGLLWFGWFGFNAGSALAASPQAGLAFVTTMLAPAATLVVWTHHRHGSHGQADERRLRHRDRRRPGRRHPRRRVHQPAERARAWRHCRGPELFRHPAALEDVARRLARCRCRARPWRHGGRAADRRVRGEGAERRVRRRAVRQSRSGPPAGRGRSRRHALQRRGHVRRAQADWSGDAAACDASDEATGLDITAHGEEAYAAIGGSSPAIEEAAKGATQPVFKPASVV